MLTVDQLRLKFSYLIISVLWINALLVIIRNLWASDLSYVAIGGVLAIAISTTLTWAADRTGQATRIISSSALSMTVILLVFSFSGHPYQVEIHMYFFAVLAMTTGWCDWKASVACAGTTALHHLLLNFLLPAAIYPGGPDVARLMVHIATLLCELAIQIWICQMLNLVFATVAVSLSENEAQLSSVEALAGERDVRAHAEGERAELRKRETDRFTGRMHGVSETFAQTARDLATAAQKLSATADETSRQASTVSSAALNASANVQTVAASTGEMSASIRQIADQVAKSSDVANIAANEAASTEKDVRALSEAASKIGEVVDLINTIAAQTNLLALNATIEAARAGESGRGFAIVAQEVKQLAAQTARATEEIATKVAEIQSATHRTVGSIDKIVGTVSQIQQISAGIGAAIAEQNLATDAIASSTNSAARGTEAVTDIIRDVDRAAEMTGAASGQLKAISDTLSSQSADLQTEVEAYVLRLQMA